jgi:hypothetical protein
VSEVTQVVYIVFGVEDSVIKSEQEVTFRFFESDFVSEAVLSVLVEGFSRANAGDTRDCVILVKQANSVVDSRDISQEVVDSEHVCINE